MLDPTGLLAGAALLFMSLLGALLFGAAVLAGAELGCAFMALVSRSPAPFFSTAISTRPPLVRRAFSDPAACTGALPMPMV